MDKRGFCCEQTLACTCVRSLAMSARFLPAFSKVLVAFNFFLSVSVLWYPQQVCASKPFGSTKAVQEQQITRWEQRMPDAGAGYGIN